MAEGQVILRLDKVVREFNIDVIKIVDFLARKGYKLELEPNAKVTPEMYQLLLEEFAPEKLIELDWSKIAFESTADETITIEKEKESLADPGKNAEKPATQTIKIFVTFDYNRYTSEFKKLKTLFPEYEFVFNDYGERFFNKEVTKLISGSQMFLALISSDEDRNSKWFRREINIAIQLEKPVIVVGMVNGINRPEINYNYDWVEGFNPAEIKNSIEKTINQNVKADSNARGYWWLNINPNKNWNISNFKPGQKTWFHATTAGGRKRKHFENFGKMAVDDLVVVFAMGIEKRVVAVFRVTEPLHDENGRPVVNFEISKLDPNFKTAAQLQMNEEFEGAEFLSDQTSTIFLINEPLFNVATAIGDSNELEIETEFEPKFNISGYASDYITEKQIDLLEITNDVKAFASLIAYKELFPPLAIALFGNWGSGKSFFMKKLIVQIEEICEDTREQAMVSENAAENVFCTKIINIEFNAWHYMDADLWASIVCHIFESLNTYVGNLSPEEKKEVKLYEELNTIKKIKEEIKEEKNAIEKKINEIKNEISIYSIKKSEGEKKYRITATEAAKECFRDENFKKEVVQAEKDLGIDKITEESLETLNSLIETYGSFKTYFFEILQTLFNFRRNWLGMIILIFLPILLFFGLQHVQTLAPFIPKVVPVLTSILGFLSLGLKSSQKALEKIRNGTNLLRKATALIEKKKEEKFALISAEISGYEAELISFEKKLVVYKNNYFEYEDKERQLNYEISQYQQGKLIANFIQRRFASDDYSKRLGLISIIRKDFETLSKYLVGDAKQPGELQSPDNPSEKEIERIVLYIDDLDRCPQEKVIQVLEAIHLLLAFPLFVVVVAVDPRWVSNALKKQYPEFLDSPDQINTGNDKKNASTLDYLEKIFQIPFSLKAASFSGISKLVDQILSPHVWVEEINDSSKSIIQVNEVQPNLSGPSDESAEVDTGTDDKTEPEFQFVAKKSDSVNTKFILNLHSPPKPLKILPEELMLMKSISDLIGKTPRTAKRFINTYRLIRSNENLDPDKKNPTNDYAAIMISLVFVVHRIELFSHFKQLIENNPNDKFLNAISKDPEMKPICDNLSLQEDSIFNNLEVSVMLKYLPVVSRYTFCIENIF